MPDSIRMCTTRPSGAVFVVDPGLSLLYLERGQHVTARLAEHGPGGGPMVAVECGNPLADDEAATIDTVVYLSLGAAVAIGAVAQAELERVAASIVAGRADPDPDDDEPDRATATP